MGRWRAWLLGLLIVVAAAGCRTDVTTRVALRADGSGSIETWVVLDAEAVAKAGDLKQVLHLDDLRKVGWQVEGPAPIAEVVARAKSWEGGAAPVQAKPGAVAVVAHRAFRNVNEANAILASLSGPNGPYRGVRLTRTTSFASTTLGARGRVDFSGGLDALGDAALVKALGGRTPAQLAPALNGGVAPTAANGSVSLVIEPHGFAFARSAAGASEGRAVVTSTLGGVPATFDVHGSQRHTTALLWAGVAALLAVAALVLFVRDHLPGRTPPPPSARRRQRHSGRDGWELVQRRGAVGGASRSEGP